MFTSKNTNPSELQQAIARALEALKTTDVTSEDHKLILSQLELLYKIENSTKTTNRVSPDALVAAAASLTGIIAILGFEHAGVITSKALGFVTKTKI